MKIRLLALSKSALLFVLALLFTVSSSNVLSASAATKEEYYREIKNYWYNDTDLATNSACGSLSGAAGGNATVTGSLESFIDAYGQAAFDVGKRSGIPYDAILAQAMLESGYGESGLTKEANNFFGIKAGTSWTGPVVTKRTAEQNASGGVYYVDAKFRAYATPEEGFQGYADFIRNTPRYAAALNYPHDPVGYITAVKAAGYATDVRYVEKVVGRLTPTQQYIASKNLFPPSSDVVYETAVPGGAINNASCVGGSGSGGTVVEIAIREAQNWQNTPDEYKKYTSGRSENWCADFVSWVYNEAGKPFTPPQIPAVTNLRIFLQQNGQYWDKSNAPPPQPGDIIIQKNNASHTNIVVEANGYMVKTVGGNEGGGGSQGAYHTTSDVKMSSAPFDIRTYSPISGWGRLP